MLLRGFRHAVPYIIGYVEERSWRTSFGGEFEDRPRVFHADRELNCFLETEISRRR